MFVKCSALLGLSILSNTVLGNIHFPVPDVLCVNQCPPGMYCEPGDKWCRKEKAAPVSYPRIRGRQAISTDGRCGPSNGGAICSATSTVYTGTCCSSAGWCGNSAAHCGTGCVSGCTGGTTTPPPTGSGTPTTDGSCGSTNGGTTCAGWSTGECCSMYGWCGNTSAHCGAGCQNGPCTGGTGNPGGPAAPGASPAPAHPTPGSFAIVGRSGVPAMHAGLLPNGRVVFLDKVEDYTEVRLPNGRFAYSSEYDPNTNTVVALAYNTNSFCAGGTFLANGDFLAVGGNGPLDWLDPTVGDGFTGIRYLTRSFSSATNNGQAWREPGNKLNSARWYPSVQTLPDGRVFVASGSLNGLDPTVNANNNPTYEILSRTGQPTTGSIRMALLANNQPYYMYPFMHLLRNGDLFIFTSKSSQIFNINTNTVVRSMPDMPGMFRTYPNTGGSVLLPLTFADGWLSKVMICGGGSYQDITSPTDPSCGVIAPEATTPTWEMDAMPEGRGMVEAVLLPDQTVLWLNGANRGAQGFLLADAPTQRALLYTPSRPLGQRWQTLATSTIPRLYHSVALLLLDGTVLVTGSGPNEMPVLTPRAGAPYITDFRVERYTPPYLSGTNANRRPTNIVLSKRTFIVNELYNITFNAPPNAKDVRVVLYHGGFVTHSVHMGHRMMVLERADFKPGQIAQNIRARIPPTYNTCPPGPYVIYVVVDGVPGVGQFVMIQ